MKPKLNLFTDDEFLNSGVVKGERITTEEFIDIVGNPLAGWLIENFGKMAESKIDLTKHEFDLDPKLKDES